ncbi:MAG: CBS domain protein [Cytophagales bacterium]|jgi:CBS domain-containing protein|nr:CBS domain-containing protein [Bacteroidota bacterium]MBS1981624.1 CBS domain-containing protein [Bacteroidota bacterium]WHZ08932.1 MAG: CBS domain protein [Cytophagales bacterium]
MGKVKDILDKKGYGAYSVSPQTMVYAAIEQMCQRNIGGVLIVDDNGALTGIFTERDYARKLILKGKSSKETHIRDLMTPNPFTVSPHTSVDDCMQLMSEKHIRHLPVTEGDKILGLISIGDVVTHVISEQKSIIQHLESYISQ